jgi:DNA-binding NarL/FixJ family response regulator
MNGLEAGEARELAAEIASELVAVAAILRRVAWRDVRERRVMAVQLAALGLPTKAIADRLGVSDRSVRNYLHGRPGNP